MLHWSIYGTEQDTPDIHLGVGGEFCFCFRFCFDDTRYIAVYFTNSTASSTRYTFLDY